LEFELGKYTSRVNVMKDEKNAQVWRSEESGCFTVRSVYEYLAKSVRGPEIEVFKHLWKVKTFPNVMITTWRVLLGRIPTRLSLSRRGVLLNTTISALCETKEESC